MEDVPRRTGRVATLDPFSQPGLWLVRTASDARYLVDSRGLGLPVMAVRIVGEGVPPAAPFLVNRLRRDSDSIRLWAVEHVTDDGTGTGFAVGACALLTLEPLASGASATLRRTTPVVEIECLGTELLDALSAGAT